VTKKLAGYMGSSKKELDEKYGNAYKQMQTGYGTGK